MRGRAQTHRRKWPNIALLKPPHKRPQRYTEAFRKTPHGRESGFGYIVFASALLELKLRDNGIRCKSLANELAERQAAAMTHAGAMHGVIQAEEVALNIADGEQAINGLAFFRAHLRIVVHMQAERNGQNGAHNGRRVERGRLDFRKELRRHVELNIFARFVCRVVAIDGFLELVGGNAQLLSELGNRIGLNLNLSLFH